MLNYELYVAEKMREFEAERLRRVNLPYVARERRSVTRSAMAGIGRLLVRTGEVLAAADVERIKAEPSLAKQG